MTRTEFMADAQREARVRLVKNLLAAKQIRQEVRERAEKEVANAR